MRMRMRMGMGMPSVLLVLHLSNLVASIKQLPGDTELSCTDDSDCIPLGHKFGCFLYRWGSMVVVFVISPHIPDASTYMISSCHHIFHPLVLTHI